MAKKRIQLSFTKGNGKAQKKENKKLKRRQHRALDGTVGAANLGALLRLAAKGLHWIFIWLLKWKQKHNNSKNNKNKSWEKKGLRNGCAFWGEGFAGKWGVMIYNVAKIECNPNRSYLHLFILMGIARRSIISCLVLEYYWTMAVGLAKR